MKKKIILSIVGICFAIIGIPIIIHILFKMNLGIKWIEAEWTAGEFLAYYGNVLSFLGTIVLSSLALWQNKKIKDESDRHTRYLEKLEIDKNTPQFIVKKMVSGPNNSNLEISINNISDNVAYSVQIFNFKLCSLEKILWETEKCWNYQAIKPNEQVNLQLNNLAITEELLLKFEMQSFDKFFIIHYYNGMAKVLDGNLVMIIKQQMKRGNKDE